VNTVDVRVRASPGLINSLDTGSVRATIDLAGAQEGERIVQLAPDQIQAPQGFRVVKITPSLLTLNLERTMRKTLPVRPRVIGRPAPGFEVAEIASEPAEVQVAGPRSRVQEIESAFTEPVSVEGLDATAAELVNVGLETRSSGSRRQPRPGHRGRARGPRDPSLRRAARRGARPTRPPLAAARDGVGGGARLAGARARGGRRPALRGAAPGGRRPPAPPVAVEIAPAGPGSASSGAAGGRLGPGAAGEGPP